MTGLLARRALLIALIASATEAIGAQQAGTLPVVGILWHAGNAEEEASFRGPLLAGFADLGYVAGKNISLDERYAAENAERFVRNARELAASNPAVIVAVSIPSALAAQRATSTIPVVFVPPPDPVGLGLVKSFSHPGGNLTGLSSMALDITSKRIQVLKETLPHLSRLALLVDPPSNYDQERVLAETRGAADLFKLQVEIFEARSPDQIAPAFARMVERHVDAALVQQSPMFFNEKRQLADIAIVHRLPILAPADLFTQEGALMSYGPSWPPMFRRVAWYVDRILKGAKPADLPVERPAVLQLAVNLRTAAALGLTIPNMVLAQAEAVIE